MSSAKVHPREPLTTRQRSILIAFYNQNPYPSASERQQLVQLTGRTSKQVQDWFSNRRRNDPRLVSGKSTVTSSPPQSMPATPIYYYAPIPPTVTTVCPCCYFPPSPATTDPSIYSCTTLYYPSQNNYFHT